jgi:hypothetical protein
MQVTLKLASGEKLRTVVAIRISEHFAVHPTRFMDPDEAHRYCWTATHIASGFAAISAVPLEIAVACALELQSIGNWNFKKSSSGRELNGATTWGLCGEIRRKYLLQAVAR